MSLIPELYDGRRKLIFASFPVTSTFVPWHTEVPLSTNKKINKSRLYLSFLLFMLLKSIASDKKLIIGTAVVSQLLRECSTFTEGQSLGPTSMSDS